MFSRSPTIIRIIWYKCALISSVTEKTAALEMCIQSLEGVSESRTSVVSVGESLGALDGVSNPHTHSRANG